MVLTSADMTGSPALTIWPNSGSAPRQKTPAECAAAEHTPTGRVAMTSDAVILGIVIFSGVCRPQSLIGLRRMNHRTSAYSVQTASCIVETVIVKPPYLPPTAVRAIVLYWL